MADFACRGWLTKQGKKVKSWKRRYFVLGVDANLTYYNDDRTTQGHLGVIDMHTCATVRLGSDCEWKDNKTVHEGLRLEIVVPDRTYEIFCDTPAMASEWAAKLRAARDSSRLDGGKQPDGATRQLHFMRDAGTRLQSSNGLRNVGSRTSLFPTLAEREASGVALSGWLFKSGGSVRNWKKRFFVLCAADGTLSYYLGEDTRLAPLGTVFLSTVVKISMATDNSWPELPAFGRPSALLALATDARTYYLLADSADSAASWLAKLQSEWARFAPDRPDDKDLLGTTKDDEDEDEDDGTEVDAKELNMDEEVDSYFGFFGLPRTRERRAILMDALRIRSENVGQRTTITVIYNPVSGSGAARKIAEQTVVPVLKLAGLEPHVVQTTHRGFACNYANTMDLSVSNTIVVCGGDGLVSEVITGLMTRGEDVKDKVFVGIVPSGTANAMANELDGYHATSHVHLTGRAALGVAMGTWREVDVLKVAMEGQTVYGMSCIGWGIAGAVAQTADRLRWLPGQRKARYDIAGFVTMMMDWPLKCHCELLFPPNAITVVPRDDKDKRKSRAPDSSSAASASASDAASAMLLPPESGSVSSRKDSSISAAAAAAAAAAAPPSISADDQSPGPSAAASGLAAAPPSPRPVTPLPAGGKAGATSRTSDGWERIGPLNVLNFIASNVPKLGKDHPICPEIKIDDGRLVVAWLDESHTRLQLANAALAMKQGKYLAYHPMMTARIATEFKCVPVLDKKGNVPYNIDGDPVPPQAMHTTILHRALRVFYCPDKYGKL